MDLRLRGKKVLITGSSKGTGRAAAFAFAEEGCDVYLSARNEQMLNEAAQQIRDRHQVNVTVIPGDLRDSAYLHSVADKAQDVDILVNNAGDIPGGSLDKIDEETWRHAWELKVFGYINLSRLLLEKMVARRSGVILNVIGVGGEKMNVDYITGTTGNAALMAFSKALGSQSLDNGVRVVGINPGGILTDRVISLYKTHALHRFGDENRYPELMAEQRQVAMSMPEDIADLLIFLGSDRARRITGTIVTIDGGTANYNPNR